MFEVTCLTLTSKLVFLSKYVLGAYDDVRKFHWIRWNKVCLDKENGVGDSETKHLQFNLN